MRNGNVYTIDDGDANDKEVALSPKNVKLHTNSSTESLNHNYVSHSDRNNSKKMSEKRTYAAPPSPNQMEMPERNQTKQERPVFTVSNNRLDSIESEAVASPLSDRHSFNRSKNSSQKDNKKQVQIGTVVKNEKPRYSRRRMTTTSNEADENDNYDVIRHLSHSEDPLSVMEINKDNNNNNNNKNNNTSNRERNDKNEEKSNANESLTAQF
jgi:hypothetical protein